jgi:transposase
MLETLELPEMPPAVEGPAPSPPPTRPEQARIRRAVRNQVEWEPRSLDEILPEQHPARAIWGLLERLDLSEFYAKILSFVDGPGRPASDPMVLLALWMLAIVEGIGSARRLASLTRLHDAYRWVRGGVPVNYHQLSAFRVGHQAELDELLTQLIATLMRVGLVSLKRVAQDGAKIAASAGASSMRSQLSLEEALAAAREQIKAVARQRDEPDSQVTARQQAARERAARERVERLERAINEELPLVQAVKERQRKQAGKKRAAKIKEPRVSTTDPTARVMKQADGGFGVDYNLQLVTDTGSQIIVGVRVTNQGADQGLALPLEREVEARTGQQPGAYLMDGGYVDLGDIATLEAQGTAVYAPPKKRTADAEPAPASTEGPAAAGPAPPGTAGDPEAERERGQVGSTRAAEPGEPAAPATPPLGATPEAQADPTSAAQEEPEPQPKGQAKKPEPEDPPEIKNWRERMETDEAKKIYRERASTAECVNAQVKGRYGLRRFLVRGVPKVTCVVLLVALTHNLMRWHALTS